MTDLRCERAYFGGTRGICLSALTAGPKTTWWAEIFDDQFRPGHRMRLTGEPSRVRVSPNGRFAAATVFETGHSYADHGFSTRTTLFDLSSGTSLGDLEQFHARQNGANVKAVDNPDRQCVSAGAAADVRLLAGRRSVGLFLRLGN